MFFLFAGFTVIYLTTVTFFFQQRENIGGNRTVLKQKPGWRNERYATPFA